MRAAEEFEKVIYKESSEERDWCGLAKGQPGDFTAAVLQVLKSLTKKIATSCAASPTRRADVAGMLCSRGDLG